MRSCSLPADEVIRSRYGAATSPARTAFDIARLPDLLESVPLLDALAQRTGVTRRQVEAVADRHAGARGVRRIGRALELVDPRAESLRESRLRVTVVLAGLPRPESQVRVYNDAGSSSRGSISAGPSLKIGLEYDGAYHDDPAQIALDRARLNALHAAGWTVLVIDRSQLARPEDVVALVRRLLTARTGCALAGRAPWRARQRRTRTSVTKLRLCRRRSSNVVTLACRLARMVDVGRAVPAHPDSAAPPRGGGPPDGEDPPPGGSARHRPIPRLAAGPERGPG